MEVYLVGGAVRDELLGLPVTERDWVVVGSSPEVLKRLGYRQVGRDFPVFLHPVTSEEYALARTERKTGSGHKGFTVHAGDEVSLEEDLARRDLTVNAIARAADGRLIDPFAGQADLAAGVLRHVSPSFSEDPLRVFRVARFAARLPEFVVAAQTQELMALMSGRNDLAELSAERVWAECDKALATDAPSRFFSVLADTSCLQPWFMELADGRRVDVRTTCVASHERFATVAGLLPEVAAASLLGRLKCPKEYRLLVQLVAQHRATIANWRDADPAQLHAALMAARAFKRTSQLPAMLRVVSAVADRDLGGLLTLVEGIAAAVTPAQLRSAGLEGAALGAALDEARIAFIADATR